MHTFCITLLLPLKLLFFQKGCRNTFSGHETIIKGTVEEVMFLLDVLEHTALLQPLAIEHSLAGVLGQAHLLEPLDKVAAKEAVNNGALPTPDI